MGVSVKTHLRNLGLCVAERNAIGLNMKICVLKNQVYAMKCFLGVNDSNS